MCSVSRKVSRERQELECLRGLATAAPAAGLPLAAAAASAWAFAFRAACRAFFRAFRSSIFFISAARHTWIASTRSAASSSFLNCGPNGVFVSVMTARTKCGL